jgi:multiple sugar transport system substrate-binding protein
MPWTIVGGMIAYRKSWFERSAPTEFPDTWEKYQEVGKKLKAKGRPIGQTLGHTFGDAPTFSYPFCGRWAARSRRRRQGASSTARIRSSPSSS